MHHNLTSSGTNRMETTDPNSSWAALILVRGKQRTSLGKDFHLRWIQPQDQFLWRSRSCRCLTLLCTTVLCSPQWQETPKLCTKTFGAKTTEYSTTSTRGSHTLLNFTGLNLHIFDSNYKRRRDSYLSNNVKPGSWWWQRQRLLRCWRHCQADGASQTCDHQHVWRQAAHTL